MYELIEQGATQSFGIHVAELAGLPRGILKRSQEILGRLEKHQEKSATSALNHQLSFFGAPAPAVEEVVEVPQYLLHLEENLKELDVMNMTPIQALSKLHELKTKFIQQ